MFDIHEELPALPEPPKIQEAKVAPATDAVQPKTRYLIKKGGKQTFGTPHTVDACPRHRRCHAARSQDCLLTLPLIMHRLDQACPCAAE